MSLGADVADHISAPGLLKNSPSAHYFYWMQKACRMPMNYKTRNWHEFRVASDLIDARITTITTKKYVIQATI